MPLGGFIMDLKKDSSYLLIKINTPENINFLEEHSNIIEKKRLCLVL